MLIVKKGEYDIDEALQDLKEKTIGNMSQDQILQCEKIIEQAVSYYADMISYTEYVRSAFPVYALSKPIIGIRLIRSIERVFQKELPSEKTIQRIDSAWDSFSEQYKIELDTRFGHMPDVMWSGTKFYKAVGWVIAGWLSVQKDTSGHSAEKSEAVLMYEKCRKEPFTGMSGFHGFGTSNPMPFSVCGWATFDGEWYGAAFRINRDSFDGRDAVLYYMDDDFFGDLQDHQMQQLQKIRDRMERYSSGLIDIRICERVETDDFMFWGSSRHPARVTTIQFRLDSSKIKETVEIAEKPVPTSQLGEYILVLPRLGEFRIELGEIIDDKRVPLHFDDFCMK